MAWQPPPPLRGAALDEAVLELVAVARHPGRLFVGLIDRARCDTCGAAPSIVYVDEGRVRRSTGQCQRFTLAALDCGGCGAAARVLSVVIESGPRLYMPRQRVSIRHEGWLRRQLAALDGRQGTGLAP